MKNLKPFENFIIEAAVDKIKVGDIVGNTVDGFDWKVMKIKGDTMEVIDTVSGKTKTTYIDNMYHPKKY
jgi:hypothetical protein